MIFKSRTRPWNRKLFVSISGGLLICSFSLLLIIERNFTEKVVHKVKTSTKEITESKKMDSTLKSRAKKSQDCYQRTATNHINDYKIEYLEDVMDRIPNTGENIFFHETTCSRSGLVHLSSR